MYLENQFYENHFMKTIPKQFGYCRTFVNELFYILYNY